MVLPMPTSNEVQEYRRILKQLNKNGKSDSVSLIIYAEIENVYNREFASSRTSDFSVEDRNTAAAKAALDFYKERLEKPAGLVENTIKEIEIIHKNRSLLKSKLLASNQAENKKTESEIEKLVSSVSYAFKSSLRNVVSEEQLSNLDEVKDVTFLVGQEQSVEVYDGLLGIKTVFDEELEFLNKKLNEVLKNWKSSGDQNEKNEIKKLVGILVRTIKAVYNNKAMLINVVDKELGRRLDAKHDLEQIDFIIAKKESQIKIKKGKPSFFSFQEDIYYIDTNLGIKKLNLSEFKQTLSLKHKDKFNKALEYLKSSKREKRNKAKQYLKKFLYNRLISSEEIFLTRDRLAVYSNILGVYGPIKLTALKAESGIGALYSHPARDYLYEATKSFLQANADIPEKDRAALKQFEKSLSVSLRGLDRDKSSEVIMSALELKDGSIETPSGWSDKTAASGHCVGLYANVFVGEGGARKIKFVLCNRGDKPNSKDFSEYKENYIEFIADDTEKSRKAVRDIFLLDNPVDSMKSADEYYMNLRNLARSGGFNSSQIDLSSDHKKGTCTVSNQKSLAGALVSRSTYKLYTMWIRQKCIEGLLEKVQEALDSSKNLSDCGEFNILCGYLMQKPGILFASNQSQNRKEKLKLINEVLKKLSDMFEKAPASVENVQSFKLVQQAILDYNNQARLHGYKPLHVSKLGFFSKKPFKKPSEISAVVEPSKKAR